MRKLIALILITGLLTAAFAGCGNTPAADTTNGSPDTASGTASSSVPPVSTQPPGTPPVSTTSVPTAAPGENERKPLPLPPYSDGLLGYTEAQCDAFFADAVFVGDSIMMGLRNYINGKLPAQPDFMGPTSFLVAGSFGAGNALDKISDKSVHPLYQGEQRFVWDSVAMMGAKKVFILFGLNDIAVYGVSGTVDNFDKVIKNIRESAPEADIIIMSATYVQNGAEIKSLNTSNLCRLNYALIDYCQSNNIPFINITDLLTDEDGYLAKKYSSDSYVHQTDAAYKLWIDQLRSFAAHQLAGLR